LNSTVLIELLVTNCDENFSVNQFTQPRKDLPKDNWQVAWAEAFLTINGEELISVESWGDVPKAESFRVAFFLHYYDPKQSIYTSYGEILCPLPDEMPERLKRLVPYELLD
jgi:hypothetical protein